MNVPQTDSIEDRRVSDLRLGVAVWFGDAGAPATPVAGEKSPGGWPL